MKILIVDDKEENLYLLESLLKGSGYEVASARDGVEALERLRRESVGMIISDILMPKMDGFQLCTECKKDETLRNIPFVFYTATYTDKKDEEFALSLGADRFLVKPMEPEPFLKTMEGVLENHKKGLLAVSDIALEEEETVRLREYNERLINKLEKKMLDLEGEIAERKRAEEKLAEHRDHLEEMVGERTEELRTMVNLMAGREVRMAELKETIEKLRVQLERAGMTPVANDPIKEMREVESEE